MLIGAPGTGKTMLARRLPTLLPPLTPRERIEVTKVWSAAGRAPNLCGGDVVGVGRGIGVSLGDEAVAFDGDADRAVNDRTIRVSGNIITAIEDGFTDPGPSLFAAVLFVIIGVRDLSAARATFERWFA